MGVTSGQDPQIIMYKIPLSQPSFDKNEWENLKECIESTWISSAGHFINKFEEKYAPFVGTKYAISVCNGTAALHLALLGLSIGQGDEVIVPALTFVASVNCVSYLGAKVVLADIDPVTWTVDPENVEELITNKTKAIIAVHLYGYPADLVRLRKIADKHGLFLIEDAAEAIGAEIKGKKVGSIGDIGCFSFYGNKIITTGEGGMITLNSKELAEKIILYKNHGEGKPKYYHPVVGFNYRMTNLQAAVGLAQLEKIDDFLSKRERIDRLYRKYLDNIPGLILPPEDTEDRHGVCWLFSFLVNNKFRMSRGQLMKHLDKYGVETRPFFIPMHKMPMYRDNKSYPVSERVSIEGLNLPTFTDLTEKEIIRIARIIKSI